MLQCSVPRPTIAYPITRHMVVPWHAPMFSPPANHRISNNSPHGGPLSALVIYEIVTYSQWILDPSYGVHRPVPMKNSQDTPVMK
jgi:hypothetical protein